MAAVKVGRYLLEAPNKANIGQTEIFLNAEGTPLKSSLLSCSLRFDPEYM
jgi:hypothetical protein